MKRTFGILVGLAAVGGVAYLGSQIWAQNYQQPAGAPAAAPVAAVQTRIAIINLSQVIKNYKKFASVQAEMNSKQATYKSQYDNYNTSAQAKKAEMAKPETPMARKEQLVKELKDIERKVQDLEEDMKKALGELQASRMVQLYKEIEDAVTVYAKARNIELVMHYNDGIGQDKYLPAFLGRRLSNGACMPVYNVPGMDITEAVTGMLNAHVTGPAPATSTPGSQIPPVPGSR